MSFPESARLELPILQELKATGGSDQLRYLYDRLIRYFPQLTSQDLNDRTETGRSRWRIVVQRVGKRLEARGELRREKDRWLLTPKGLRRIQSEELQLEPIASLDKNESRKLTHKEVQEMLVDLGGMLGRRAEAEVDHFDVVWRESANAPRHSHVFEVQISGSVDSALTRLKHAYETQRSKVFLVIADERDKRFAGKRLTGSFHEIWDALEVIGVGELQRLYEAIKSERDLIAKIIAK